MHIYISIFLLTLEKMMMMMMMLWCYYQYSKSFNMLVMMVNADDNTPLRAIHLSPETV